MREMVMRGDSCFESSPAMEINGFGEPKAAGERGLKLFGVRILGKRGFGEEEEVMRKSASMGDLVSCDAGAGVGDVELGYLSDGCLVGGSRRKRGCQERKRGIPWTEEEHKTFLAGLKTLGKGDWRGISRNFVPTRTPTQVASHAQKYFLRQSNPNKKKRRSSLFDVVIDETAIAGEIVATLSLKNTHEATQVPDHLCKDIHMVGTPSFNTIQSAKVSEALTPTIHHVQAPTNANLMAGILGSTKEQAILSIVPTFDIPEELHTRVPDFLKLSLTPHPHHHLAQVSAAPAFIESNDLSLSIGPPRPRNLGEFPSGAIRVI